MEMTGRDFIRNGAMIAAAIAGSGIIGIHPMTQILEESGFKESINRQPGIKEKIQFVIRTGYADRFPEYRKLRLPASLIVK